MNHCIDVICANCGFMYCLMGCTPPAQKNDELMKEALQYAQVVSGIAAFHYQHHVCRRCKQQTVYDIPANFNGCLVTIKTINRIPRNKGTQ